MARAYKKRLRRVGRPAKHDPLAIHRFVEATRHRLGLSANQACARIKIGLITESGDQWVQSVLTGSTLRRIYVRNRATFAKAMNQ